MDAKHTPVPWFASCDDETREDGAHEITAMIEGKRVCIAQVEGASAIFDRIARGRVMPPGASWNCDVEDELDANARFIVRAVNSHEALVAALRDLLDGSEPWDERATQARAALALAEQGRG